MRKGKGHKKIKGKVTKAWVEKEIHKLTPAIEMKQALNQPGAATLDNTNGTAFQVVAPVVGADLQQGTAHNQRVGDVINVKGFKIAFTTSIRSTFPDAPLRMFVVYDRQSQGTSIALADLFYLQGATSGGYTINQEFNSELVGAGKRFRILYDKVINHKLPANAVSATTNLDPRNHVIRKRFKGKGLRVQFYQNSILGGLNAIESGAITLYLYEGNANTNNCLTMYGMTKTIEYTDA